MWTRNFSSREIILSVFLLISIVLNIVLVSSRHTKTPQQAKRVSSPTVISNSQYKVGDKFIGLLPPEISSQVPFYGDYIDIDNDGVGEVSFYNVIAMTKPPHVAYIVKDGVIIFRYEGARVSISDRAGKPGFTITEWTMEDVEEAHKVSTYSYEAGKIDKVVEELVKEKL